MPVIQRCASPSLARPLRIGPVQLATNLLLAPVANYCDLAWRLVCREQGGVGLACTDLLSPHGLLRGTPHSLDLAQTTSDDRPLCMQLYGNDPDVLSDGAAWAVDHGATTVDINMGCPVDKVVKKNGGSMLLCDPARTVAMASRVVESARRASLGRVPVTAKMRLGWGAGERVAPALALALARVGVAAITVHGRTAAQKFTGEADLDGIRAVVEHVAEHIGPPRADGTGGPPIIGNGDVTEPQHALRMMELTGCAGVMIGRGSFSRPWLFRRAWALLTTGDAGPEPGEAEIIAIIERYLDLMLEHRGEHYAMTHIRRRISWLAKPLPPCKAFKEAVRTAEDAGAVRAALAAYARGELRGGGPREHTPAHALSEPEV